MVLENFESQVEVRNIPLDSESVGDAFFLHFPVVACQSGKLGVWDTRPSAKFEMEIIPKSLREGRYKNRGLHELFRRNMVEASIPSR